MISVVAVAKYFSHDVALHDVTFSLEAGAVLQLVGPNGAGKTTLLRILSGVERADSGAILLMGIPLAEVYGSRGGAVRLQIGASLGLTFCYAHMTIAQNLRFYADLYGVSDPRAAVEAMLFLFDLGDHAHKEVQQLSQGLAKRVELARALIHRPSLLFLDEPVAHLDDANVGLLEQLLGNFKRDGGTVVYSSHEKCGAGEFTDYQLELRNGVVRRFGPAIASSAASVNDSLAI